MLLHGKVWPRSQLCRLPQRNGGWGAGRRALVDLLPSWREVVSFFKGSVLFPLAKIWHYFCLSPNRRNTSDRNLKLLDQQSTSLDLHFRKMRPNVCISRNFTVQIWSLRKRKNQNLASNRNLHPVVTTSLSFSSRFYISPLSQPERQPLESR